MSEHGASFDRSSFVAELDGVAEVLKTTVTGHAGHEGWMLRSTGELTCGCGEALYVPEPVTTAPVPPAEGHGMASPGVGDQPSGRQVVVRPPAEIDIATADAFSRDLSQAFAQGPDTVVIDFAGTTFCDSTALRLLVNAARQAHASHCRLHLVHAPRQLRLMAEILGAAVLLGLPPSRT